MPCTSGADLFGDGWFDLEAAFRAGKNLILPVELDPFDCDVTVIIGADLILEGNERAFTSGDSAPVFDLVATEGAADHIWGIRLDLGGLIATQDPLKLWILDGFSTELDTARHLTALIR
jgi:hypothetical protein